MPSFIMGDFIRFWRRACRIGAGTATRLLATPLGKAISGLIVAGSVAVSIQYGEPLFERLGLDLGPNGTGKDLLKGVLGALAPVGFLALVIVFTTIFYAPIVLWRTERRKNVGFPYDAETPFFRVTECWPGQPPSLARYWEVTAILELTRNIENAELKVWGYEDGASRHLIRAERVSGLKGQKIRLLLATVAINDDQVRGCHFGDENGPSFSENGLKLARIEMTGGNVVQEYRVIVTAMRTVNETRQLNAVTPDWNPYFWPDRTS